MASSEKSPTCACGCGKSTSGGSFRPGHDQRLYGMLTRGESIGPLGKRYIAAQPKSSKWHRVGKSARPAKAKRAKPRAKRSRRAQPEAVPAAA